MQALAHRVLPASTPQLQPQVSHLFFRVLFALQDTQEQLLALVQLVQLTVTFALRAVMLLLVRHHVRLVQLAFIKLLRVNLRALQQLTLAALVRKL